MNSLLERPSFRLLFGPCSTATGATEINCSPVSGVFETTGCLIPLYFRAEADYLI